MTTKIKNVINELSDLFPGYKFSKEGIVYQAEAIINIRCKPGTEDLAYYAGDDYGYCVLGSTFYDIHNHIKSAFPDYKVIDFINSKRTGHFELHK